MDIIVIYVVCGIVAVAIALWVINEYKNFQSIREVEKIIDQHVFDSTKIDDDNMKS